MTETSQESIAEQPQPMTWTEFLQEHPPGSFVTVKSALKENFNLEVPYLQLYCSQETCNGYMFFESDDRPGFFQPNRWEELFLTYSCRNCGRSQKIFALTVKRKNSSRMCEAYKFGEYPSFGPPTPPRVIKMIGPDRELFLKGRRCENQALGIGAFTYYRRVVENQWERLIGQIIRVAEATRARPETIALLEEAKQETQFSKSVEILKNAIPSTLLINGHNPLVLLHGPLSQGVHALSDEECLSLATSIRVVLAELADKVSSALKDERELKDAVSHLLQNSAKKKDETAE